MLPKVRNKRTKEIFYFRFFSEESPDEFFYTKTIDATGFDYGRVSDFTPLNKTWEEILHEELQKDL